MPLTSASMRASVSWDTRKAVTGFNTVKHKDSLAGSYTAAVATYQHVLVARYTLAAAGTQTVDLYSVTEPSGEAATATKFKGILLVCSATVTGGQLKVEPGASNPFALGLSGTTPALTLDVGTAGCTLMLVNGISMTVSNTVKNVKLSNPGSQTVTVDLFALLGE